MNNTNENLDSITGEIELAGRNEPTQPRYKVARIAPCDLESFLESNADEWCNPSITTIMSDPLDEFQATGSHTRIIGPGYQELLVVMDRIRTP
jgi:hypothetical protein